MITVIQETTDWAYPNHQYHLNGSGELVAYQVEGEELRTLKHPMKRFSKSRRKFKTIRTIDTGDAPIGTRVAGSNGKFYYVLDGTCTCPGFKFRRKCKHIQTIKETK